MLQALRCLEKLLVSSPQAQLALMEASLPLREGGALPRSPGGVPGRPTHA